MDEKRLKSILGQVPAADENAKTRAVNLAVAEFAAAQAEEQREKNFQGSSWFAHLIGRQTDKTRSSSMYSYKRKLMYGGFATASAALLAVTSAVYVAQEKAPYEPLAIDVDDLVAKDEFARKEHALLDRAEEESMVAPTPQTAPVNEPAIAPASKSKVAPERKLGETRQRVESQNLSADLRKSGVSGLMRQAPAEVDRALSPMVAESFDADIAPPEYYQDVGRDKFEDFEVNPVKLVSEAPVSTFSIDVDTASYSFVRKMINSGVLPQKDAVRIEEMINYFDYDYPLAESREHPFKPTVALAPSPWAPGKQLMHIGIKGYDIVADEKPRSNLVFLLDVSGSMNSPDKLPLVIRSMKMLLDGLSPDDTVAIVVYAGAAGTVLEPTPASESGKIIAALDRLNAGGSTAGAEGIRQAYALAESQFEEEAVNRVILATDGDFNVGITNPEELQDFVERKRETGIYLSILGFGQGNLNDQLMQKLAQNGNGVAAYIDTLNEARKVLVDEATSNIFPIAQDVKIQVEFNPATVAEYRLIGYETRALNREDFNNDAVDAGDIGAGHTVTAIYEFTPVGSGAGLVDERRYGQSATAESTGAASDFSDEYAFLKIRYKLPGEDSSTLMTRPITAADSLDQGHDPSLVRETSFATAVAGFGQLLKGGKYTGDLDYDDVAELARKSKGDDQFGYRSEFVQLVRLAKTASKMPSR